MILLLVSDSVSIQFVSKLLKRRIHVNLFRLIKYSYCIILPMAFAIFIRTFFFDIYFIPSSSMENALFRNDYVLINKVLYGTKVPKCIQHISGVKSLFKNEEIRNYNIYRPLKVFKFFKREDIVVFKSVNSNKFIIKRIIGIPGDSLEINDSKVSVNNNLLNEKSSYCYNYLFDSEINTTQYSKIKTLSNAEFENLSESRKKNLQKHIISKTTEDKWTRDNYGKIIVPKKGMTIILNRENFTFYKSIIRNYEEEELYFSNDEANLPYTFKYNYYFMLGDNRHNSMDSRSFGLIPESYIQGKVFFVFGKGKMN